MKATRIPIFFFWLEPESHQTDFRWAWRGSLSSRRDARWLQEELKEPSGRASQPGKGWAPFLQAGQELGQPYLTLLKLKPIPGKCCCFDPSSREWVQMKLKQVLIKTRTIIQTGLLITVNICQGKLQRKIVISRATCHFHLITITLFYRAKISALHNKLLSWELVWIESREALPWVPKLAA